MCNRVGTWIDTHGTNCMLLYFVGNIVVVVLMFTLLSTLTDNTLGIVWGSIAVTSGVTYTLARIHDRHLEKQVDEILEILKREERSQQDL